MPHYFNTECFLNGYLEVSTDASIYYELSGSRRGTPVLFLHGGPGAGLPQNYQRFFDPEHWMVVGFDQRGCGRSTPLPSLSDNTTQKQLEDIETLRHKLGIEKWVVLGGSWGATLGLLYAIAHPQRVQHLVLRGVFLGRRVDTHWFLDPQGGAAQLYPDAYRDFIADIGSDTLTPNTILQTYYNHFQADGEEKANAVKRWCHWEEVLSQIVNAPVSVSRPTLSNPPCKAMHDIATLECHYLVNQNFIPNDFILDNTSQLATIPGDIIHGRFDAVCSVDAAYSLHEKWAKSKLNIVPNAGHSLSEPGIGKALLNALAELINRK